MAEKDLAVEMKQKEQNQKLLEKIRKIEEEIKVERDNDNITVRYHEDCELTLGGNIIKVSVAEVEEKKEDNRTLDEDANKESNTVKTYNIYINVKGQDIKIAEINQEGRLLVDKEAIEKIDPENRLGLKELGEEEKPDISEINRVEGKTSEELEEEIGEKELDIDKSEEKEIKKDEKDDKKLSLQKINISVLKVLYPQLRECEDAYLDRNTNSLIFKNKNGEVHTPEEYGFNQAKSISGSFQINKMNENGEISSHENPTNIYIMEGNNYGISIDFKTHNREVNVIVKDIEQQHVNSYSIIAGNLTKSDSGEITKYQAQERIGTREGWDAGERRETNEKAKEFISGLNKDDANKFKQGFENEIQDNHRINDNSDLKKVIADILQKEYKENPDDALEIATEIVDKGREYDEIKKEREEVKRTEERARENDEDEGREKTPWDDAMRRRGF